MHTTRNMKRIIAAALLSGGVAVVGLGLGAGAAQADICRSGQVGCWCPGDQLPNSYNQITWDMSVCHQYYTVSPPPPPPGSPKRWPVVVEGVLPPAPGFPWP
jgi:hypothetical protein